MMIICWAESTVYKENRGTLSATRKEALLGVNAEKIKYMFMSFETKFTINHNM